LVKKVSYIVGDIFEIELENGLKGFGKILIIDKPSIFIELYKMQPVVEEETIDETEKYLPILSIWSTDLGLKKGIWKIFKNEPVIKEVKMPDFWKRDALNHDKIILIRGTETLQVTEDQIGNAQPYGIFGHEAVRIRYAYELKQSGLL